MFCVTLALRAMGEGTTFQIYLPRSELVEARVSGTRPRVAAASPRAETVLVVEDEPSLRNITVRVLTQAGHRVLALSTTWDVITA